ncbi:hypothetical protein D3C81_2072980 [compost metagenome]
MTRQCGGLDALDAIALGARTGCVRVVLQRREQLGMVGGQIVAVDHRRLVAVVGLTGIRGAH